MKKQDQTPAEPPAKRISPELSEVLHMLGSLEARNYQDAGPVSKAG